MIKAEFTKSLTIALREDTYLKLKELTDEEITSMAHWVRHAIYDALEREEEENRSNETEKSHQDLF